MPQYYARATTPDANSYSADTLEKLVQKVILSHASRPGFSYVLTYIDPTLKGKKVVLDAKTHVQFHEALAKALPDRKKLIEQAASRLQRVPQSFDPLENPADALRLAVELKLTIAQGDGLYATIDDGAVIEYFANESERLEATCHAITRAASLRLKPNRP